MEDFETVLKKYRFSISRLESENATLAKRSAAGEKESVAKQLQDAKLKSEYHNLRRFVDSLPEEVMRQARVPKRTQDHQR